MRASIYFGNWADIGSVSSRATLWPLDVLLNLGLGLEDIVHKTAAPVTFIEVCWNIVHVMHQWFDLGRLRLRTANAQSC
jgi:hypothetical protein